MPIPAIPARHHAPRGRPTRLPNRALFLATVTFATTVLPGRASAQLLPAAPADRCTALAPDSASAVQWLDRAAGAVLPPTADGRVLRARVTHDVPLWEQSDRMYPPFVPNTVVRQLWYDPVSGITGRQPVERAVPPGSRPAELFSPTTSYVTRDTMVIAMAPPPGYASPMAPFNPWSVLAHWRERAAEVRVVARCIHREYPRIVLELGGERLHLSASDATPVKLERENPHYLWGQVRAEYLWNTWWGVNGGGRYPLSSALTYDGELYHRVGTAMGSAALVTRDSTPDLSRPAATMAPPAARDFSTPDTIRVSANTWLLRTPAYTHAVTLQRDTIFLLDATTSEARSRGDSAWIARLFPGRYPIVLIVTDLAWPHISGVRFWVARGATIVSHGMSEGFLRRVVDRRWTLAPDALEVLRASGARPRWSFRAVGDSLRLAGGAITVHAMRGTSTEGAVGAWIGPDRFFWAGDYVQGTETSPYQRDVVRTIKALGLTPHKVGAQHVPLSDWSVLSADPVRSGRP
ncbi:MAG TPA: hypothetical protein VLE53_13380 [Gemmatimonadaceae bacterium]|nr:hypothetical protein [Gemmatimonadaceae bacterium]